MLDTLVKLTEKLIELSKYRAERHEQHFEKLVVPIYEGMLKAHQDYLSMFEEAHREIESGTPFNVVAANLARARLEDEAKRHAVLNQAHGLLGLDDLVAAKPFLKAVVNYFYNSPFSGGNTPSYMLLQTLEDLEGEIVINASPSRYDPRDSIKHSVEMTLEILRRNWGILSSEFAKQRAKALK